MRVYVSTFFPSSSPSDLGTGPIGAFSSGQRVFCADHLHEEPRFLLFIHSSFTSRDPQRPNYQPCYPVKNRGEQLQPGFIVFERTAREFRPLHGILQVLVQVGHDEADAREQLACVPFDLGHQRKPERH
tara:strand:+ start:1605 stop:1991 length:387 start_codon:yes stop_codon:yes gene_type:complete